MSDYYAFGMAMPGRSYQSTSSSYRYGYQGSEKDDEISGKGNSYTTFFRQLDPRLGRWFSPDPVFQPWQSPYTSMDNNPINLNDVMGDETDGGPGDSHTVESGDNLSVIAEKYDGVSADDIYEANKDLIGSDKDLIKPGQVLEIPKTEEVKEEVEIEAMEQPSATEEQDQQREAGWGVKLPESKEDDTNSFLDMVRSVDSWAEDTMDPIEAQNMASALGGPGVKSKLMDENMVGEPDLEHKPQKWITEEPTWMKKRREEEQEAKTALMNGSYPDVEEKLYAYYEYYTNQNRLYILTDYNYVINGKRASVGDTGVAVKHYGDSVKFLLYSRDNKTNFGTIDTNVTTDMLNKYGNR